MDDSTPSELAAHPLIVRHLADAQLRLPQTVARWVSPQFLDLDHATYLEAAIAWGESIKRFPSVRKQMRREDAFWSAYAQLRLSWWLAQCGVEVLEFEPPTVGKKRADIRCRLANAEVDLEVFSPAMSADLRQHIEIPKCRLLRALDRAGVAGVDIELDHGPQASYRQITDEVARRVAKAVVDAVNRGLPDAEGVVLTFRDVTVTHVLAPTLHDEFRPEDEMLRIRVFDRPGGGGSLRHGHDVMAFLKRSRPGLPEDSGDIDWLTSSLRKKAMQLTPDRVSGIWIEGTNDNDLFSLLTVPWGVQRIVEDFWGSRHGKQVDFIGFFELAPGLPYPLPGVRGLGGIMVNPHGRIRQGSAAHKALSELWKTWNDRVASQIEP